MQEIHSPIPSLCTVPVAIYTRVSTHRQVGGRFDSCESQAAICRDYIRRRVSDGWFEVACYTDPAFSGGTMDRPGIQALKSQIASGSVKIVLIYKLERLMRCTDEWSPFRAFLKQHGCVLVTTSEGPCGDTPSERLKDHLLMSVAEYERLNTADKVRKKLLEQAKRGFWNCGMVPFGYTYDKEAKILNPCVIESPIVKQIYIEAAQLVPAADIVAHLNNGGVKTRTRTVRNRAGEYREVGGNFFTAERLRNLVRNPIYAGRVRFNKQEFPGQHMPIVDADLWDRASAAIEQSPRAIRRKRTRAKHFHLLKGLVYCGCCDRPMVPNGSGKRAATGNPYRYYTCGYGHYRNQNPCVVRHVSADALEAVMIQFISMCARHPDILDEAVNKCTQYSDIRRESTERAFEKTRNAINVINEQIERCVQFIQTGRTNVVDDELREKITGLKHAKSPLLVEHEKLRQELVRYDTRIVDTKLVRNALDHIREILPTLPPDEQRDLVELVAERVEVHPTQSPKRRSKSCGREFELRIHMRLVRIVEGMASRLVVPLSTTRSHPRKGRAMVMKISFILPSAGTSRPIVILTPARHEIHRSEQRPPSPVSQKTPRQNPMLRALNWHRMLATDPNLSRVKLAKLEKVTPGTITHHLKLMHLHPKIQLYMANPNDPTELRCFSLNKMKALAELPTEEQITRFPELNVKETVVDHAIN